MSLEVLRSESKCLVVSRIPLPKAVVFCASVALLVLLAKSALTQHRREMKVPEEIVRQLMNDEDLKNILEEKHEYTIEGLAKRLVAELVDLNDDRRPEIIVRGVNDLCGAANCVHWVYRSVENRYQLLLQADSIQQFELQKKLTNGYRDITTSMHGSASDSDLTLYRFNGSQYRRVRCFERTYRYEDSRGRLRDWKRPRITRVECEPE